MAILTLQPLASSYHRGDVIVVTLTDGSPNVEVTNTFFANGDAYSREVGTVTLDGDGNGSGQAFLIPDDTPLVSDAYFSVQGDEVDIETPHFQILESLLLVKSLSTVSDADTYFGNRLFNKTWMGSSSDDKQKALNQATEIINMFNYVGSKTVADQVNEWPRDHVVVSNILLPSNTVPDGILIAQYEIAGALLDGVDPEREFRNLRVTSRGFSSVRTTYDPKLAPEHLEYGVPSALAWSYLSTFLNRGSSGVVRLHRVT